MSEFESECEELSDFSWSVREKERERGEREGKRQFSVKVSVVTVLIE